MPSNLLKLSSSSMEPEFHHSSFERSGSFDSQGSRRSRSRSSTLDDENLKYLTNEEKNALMFLEETLDAFEDDVEESPVPLNSSFGYYSNRSTEDDHSDNEDIIDLVQNENIAGNSLGSSSGKTFVDQNSKRRDSLSETTLSTNAPMIIPTDTGLQHEDISSSAPTTEHPKLIGASPTPVVIAQKISERKTDIGHLPLILPKDEKLPELKKSVATSPISDSDFAFLSSPMSKLSRFPNNISVKRAGKEYNKTIAKAAVNVQERRAKVLANLHAPGLAEDVDGRTREPVNRRTSFRDVAPEQARYIALTKLGLINEVQVQADLHATSACTSPVSNGQHSPTFFLPESQRLSNEQVRNNNSQPMKVFSPEQNKKISHGQHSINSNQSPMVFPPESSKRFSNEQHYFNGPLSPKLLSPELDKKGPPEQHLINGPQSPKIMSPESNKKGPQEQHFINGPQYPKIMSPESNKKGPQEQHFINGPQSPKILSSESSKNFSHEQHFINIQKPAKFLPPESYKKMSGPSKEQDHIGGQHATKSLPSESNRGHSNEHESISSVLSSAPSSFVPLGKTVVIKGEPLPSSDKSKLHNNIHVNNEEKPNARQEIKRTYSVPRPTGFRPQGITVQFSGRHSSEESRKDALRKLGLLKEEYRP